MALLQPYKPKQKYVPKVGKPEEQIQRAICRYLDLQYPRIIYRSDLSSGRYENGDDSDYQKSKLRAMNSSRGWPDLFIYEPMTHGEHHYCGLALELKAEGTSVVMKIGPRKGRLSTDRHIQEQALILKALIAKGYYANFAVGLDEAIRIIDWYMLRPQTAELF